MPPLLDRTAPPAKTLDHAPHRIGARHAPTQILCFHGGGGVGGNPAMIEGFGKTLTRRGDIAITLPRYRVLNTDPSATLEDMIADAQEALRLAKQTKGQIWVMGASFGGLLALEAVRRAPEGVAGLILLNPVTQIGSGGFANRVVDPAQHADLSPIATYKGHPALAKLRCLILHGGADDVVPIAASRNFAAIWPKARCTLIEVGAATHGFFNRTPHDIETAAHIQRFIAAKPATPTRQLPKDVRLLCCLGGQKAGTSWLYDQIVKSPQVHDSGIKERHYFDVLWLNEAGTFMAPKIAAMQHAAAKLQAVVTPDNARPLRELQKLARHLAPYAGRDGDHGAYVSALTEGRGTARVMCDFSPSYCGLSANHLTQIAALGDVRFLFVLRDPVARMWSQIRMKTAAQGGADIAAHCTATAQEMLRTGRMARIYRADYARTLAALDQAGVPALVVFYETLFDQPTFDKIAQFAGIDAHKVDPRRKINEGLSIPLPGHLERPMVDALRGQYDAVIARFGSDVPQSWRDRLDRHRKVAPQAGIAARASPLDAFRPKRSRSVRPQIVFLHIPKTAGQSIVQELRKLCGAREISPVRTHTQAAEDAQFPPGYSVYAGHLDWGDLGKLAPDRFSFSVLRSPRERIASFYFYLLREAQGLLPRQLALSENTGKRTILEQSPDAYFFGGDAKWQAFIKDHYANFYCTYFATRKIRGWREVRTLSEGELLDRAINGTKEVSAIYGLSQLDKLEADLGRVLASPVHLQSTRVNAGPPARSGTRWDDLMGRLESDANRRKLAEFATHDEALMRRLGLGCEFE